MTDAASASCNRTRIEFGAPEIRARGLEGPLAMSFAQQGLVSSYDRLSVPETQHMVLPLTLTGALDIDTLRASIDQLTVRHSMLRAHFVSRDGTRELFVREHIDTSLRVVDVSGTALEADDGAIRELITEQRRPRFDLAAGPLFRVVLIRRAAERHVLAIVIHHAVCDAWSFNILAQELGAIYAAKIGGNVPALAELRIEFTDYTAWLREMIGSETGGQHLEYWRERLAGAKEPFWLPRDECTAAGPPTHRHLQGMELAAETIAALRAFARRHHSTVPVVMLSALAAVLSSWSGNDEVLLALAHFGRHRPQTWPLVGCLMQAWPLRVDLSGEPSFIELVRRVHQRTTEAQTRIAIPFSMTKQFLAQQAEENPLLHITFNHLPALEFMRQTAWTADLDVRLFAMPTEAPGMLDEGRGEKLVFNFVEAPGFVRVILRYSATRFSSQSIDRFWDRFDRLLESVIANPEVASRPLYQMEFSAAAASARAETTV